MALKNYVEVVRKNQTPIGILLLLTSFLMVGAGLTGTQLDTSDSPSVSNLEYDCDWDRNLCSVNGQVSMESGYFVVYTSDGLSARMFDTSTTWGLAALPGETLIVEYHHGVVGEGSEVEILAQYELPANHLQDEYRYDD